MEVKNLEFDMESVIWVKNYQTVDISYVESGRIWYIWCDTLTIDECGFTGDAGLIVHKNRSGVDAYHTIQNSTFSQTGQGLTLLGAGYFYNADVDVVYTDNTYTFERSYGGANAFDIGLLAGNVNELLIRLEDNDLDNRRVTVGAPSNCLVGIYYDANIQDNDQCAEDVILRGMGQIGLILDTWKYQSSTYTYETFTGVTVPEAAAWSVCTLGSDETVYVRFQVAGSHSEDNEDIVAVVVEYGETTSYGGSVSASWCVDESEWQAEFPASSATMYWRPKATICDETEIGPAKSNNRPKTYICAEPIWYCF